ncbi:hypothetical protein [Celeribacter marinus]|uniref:hypothetical protein n=1 Tax=Celeribacter marinus TaxID=1397108 RepID=UPI003F6ABBDC
MRDAVQNVLEQLRQMTVVVADSGEVELVKRLLHVDCTTTPSLVRAPLQDPASEDLVALEDVLAQLARRQGVSGIEEKAGR